MGPDKLADWARTFGIGDTAAQTDLSRVRGFAPTTAWKRATFGDVWTVGDSYNVAIGQGYLIVTPLEMANIIATIANGGTLYKPRLVHEIVDVNGAVVRTFAPEVVRTLPIKPQNMKAIQDALVSVVGPEGTARSVQIPGLTYAGKTGTAEFCDDIAQKTGVCYPGIRVQPSHAWFCRLRARREAHNRPGRLHLEWRSGFGRRGPDSAAHHRRLLWPAAPQGPADRQDRIDAQRMITIKGLREGLLIVLGDGTWH